MLLILTLAAQMVFLTRAFTATSLIPSKSFQVRRILPKASSKAPLTTLRGGASDQDAFPTWSFNDACTTMEVSSLPTVEFNLKNTLPSFADMGEGQAVVYGVVGSEKDADEDFKLKVGSPEAIFDEAFSGMLQASIEENAEVREARR